MGGTTSTTYESAINNVVNDVMNTSATQCRNAMLQNALNDIRCKGGININGVDISQTGNMTSNCSSTLESTTNISSELSNKLSSKIATEMQALLSAASNSDSNVQIHLKNNIQNTVTNSLVQNCINTAYQNLMNNISSNGVCTFSNIAFNQDVNQSVQCVSTAIINNLTKDGMINASKLQNTFTQQNPIAGVISAIGTAISDAISSLTQGPAMLLIMFFVFILIIVVIYKFASGGGQESVSSQSQPQIVYERRAAQVPTQ